MTVLGWLRRHAPVVLATIGVLILDAPRILLDDGVAVLRHFPADDAFYYLRLAASAPTPEFTSGIVTTGFHPLFWVVLTPVAKLLDDVAAVRGLLLLCLVLHVAAGWVAAWAIHLRHPDRVVLAGVFGALWIASPLTRAVSLSGVESPLIALCLMLLLAAIAAPRPEQARWWVLLGALVGVTYLARNDSVIVSGPVVLALLVAWRPRRLVRVAGTVVASALVVTIPWLVFLVARDSFPRQDSARALALVFDDRSATEGLREVRITLVDNTTVLVGASNGDTGLRGIVEQATGSRLARLAISVLVVGAVAVVAALAGRRLLRSRRDWPHIGFLVGVGALYVLYGLVLEVRPWYLVYWFVACTVIVLPELAVEVARRLRPLVVRRPLVGAAGRGWLALGLACALALALLARSSPDSYPQEADKLLAARAVAARGIPAAQIASRNAGIYNWFLGPDLLNVDGVVNPTVHDALRTERLCPYLRQHGIRYLLDDPEAIDRVLRAAPGAAIVSRDRLSDDFPATHDVADVQELARIELDC